MKENFSFRQAIANFSVFFVEKYRLAMVLFIALGVLGYASYTSFLKREGFPSVDIPFVIVQAPYFVGDGSKVNNEVTKPIEDIVLSIDDVVEVRSTTTDNFATLVVEFPEEMTAEEGEKTLRDEIESKKTGKLADVEIKYRTVDAGKYDGINDFILTVAANSSSINADDLESKAAEIVDSLDSISLIQSVNVIELSSERVNPETGDSFTYQDRFDRVGKKNDDGDLVFSDAISIGVVKKSGADSIQLSDAIRAKVNKLIDDGDLDEELFNVIYTTDVAVGINDQIKSLENNAATALIAVTVVVFLLVGWRASLLAAIFIPVSMATTFLVLYIMGYTLNVIVLFSLILVLGLLVDDAIVVVESIDRSLRQGKRGIKAIYDAISSIGVADVLGTITTVLVFIPLLFTTGILGEFIYLLPVTVIASLIVSLLIALSITVFLASIILVRTQPKPDGGSTPHYVNLSDLVIVRYDLINVLNIPSRMLRSLGRSITRFVDWYLRSNIRLMLVIVTSLVLIGVGASFAGRVPFSVFPSPKDTDKMSVTLTYPANTEIKKAEYLAKRTENIILDIAEEDIERIDYLVADRDTAWMMLNLTEVGTREKTSKDILKELEKEFDGFSGARVKVEELSAGPPTGEYPFTMQVYNNDPEVLRVAAKNIVAYMNNLEILDGEKVEEVVVDQLDVIAKKDGKRYIQVKAKTTDPENTGLVLNLQEKIEEKFDADKLKDLGLDEDALKFDFGQESENIDSFDSVVFAMFISLIVMYAILLIQFNSFLQPLLIFLAIPLSFPGLFPGLYATGNAISFFVMIGITGLIGIVVNNSIMLVDYTNQVRSEEDVDSPGSIRHSIIKALQARFRPIVATSLTTVAGLIPLALSDPFWEPLALSIIFGLISSMVLVILVFPAYYTLFERIRRFKSHLPLFRALEHINKNGSNQSIE